MTQKDVSKTQKTFSTEPFKNDNNRSLSLSLMRVIACLGIVVLHTVFAANEYFASTITAGQDLASRTVENNMMWAVPAFVMVTGALQLDPNRTLTLRKLYGRYILRILIALIACCIIFRLFDMILDGEPFTFGGVMYAFVELVTSRSWGHLWYLYLLIGLYILLPFYRMIVAKATNTELIYLCGAYLLFVSVIPMIEGFGLSIGFYISESIIYPLYLFIGSMIHHERLRIGMRLGMVLLIASTLVIIAMDYLKYTATADVPDVLFGYASPVVIAQATGMFAVVRGFGDAILSAKARGGLLATLDKCTFGIYLIHMAFIRLLFRYLGFDPYTGMSALTIAAIVASISIVSFAIVWALRKVPGIRRVL